MADHEGKLAPRQLLAPDVRPLRQPAILVDRSGRGEHALQHRREQRPVGGPELPVAGRRGDPMAERRERLL